MVVLKGVLPVMRNLKEFERLLASSQETIIFLEVRLAQLKPLVAAAKKAGKKVILHADLIQGLKADAYGFEYLIREVKPDGIVSTRSSVIALAKKNKLTTIQRLFLLDSHALEHNRPEHQVALVGFFSGAFDIVEDPFDFRSGKIRVDQ